MSFTGPLAQWHLLRRWRLGVATQVAVSLALVAGLAPLAAFARKQAPAEETVALARLPAEAQVMHRSIYAGGPFEHGKDGAVFGNRERALPAHERGYYREYTVPTPGARDRGARRIVCGGAQPKTPDACYYTADHYTRFYRILP